MQTAATHVARQLNAMSYTQQQAVRTLVSMLLKFESPEILEEILAATTFMSDLVKIDSDEDDSESSSNELSDGRTSGGDKESDSGIEDMEGGDEEEESDSYNGSDMDMSDD